MRDLIMITCLLFANIAFSVEKGKQQKKDVKKE